MIIYDIDITLSAFKCLNDYNLLEFDPLEDTSRSIRLQDCAENCYNVLLPKTRNTTTQSEKYLPTTC